ncbi:MAG: HAMP domain-containing histidine kinase [Defluviitaleaceae bacterium]|nr:HAMP domain-containing histidine kinase [Defluviitaleaceae bacterium]
MRDWLDIAFGIYFAAILWLIGCLTVRHWRNQKKSGQKVYSTEQIMFGVGLILFICAAVVDFGYVNAFFYIPYLHMTGVAVLVFALCEAAAVFTATMKQQQHLEAENAALESLSRMKTDYITNISHETKTPLTVISVHIQQARTLYAKSGNENKIICDSLQLAQKEIMRVARMTENALWLASMQSNITEMTLLDTEELLVNSAEAFRSFIEKRKNELFTYVPEELPQITGNTDRLIQVIANLITNANAHTENGIISLAAVRESDCIAVTIKDTGTGITPKLLPRVFERGVSGSGSTGVGLAICKEIIEARGGTISIESEKGTAVTFTIPVYKSEVESDD